MTNREKAVARDLAKRVAEAAAGEENRKSIKRWHDVNALRAPDRAPIWCRPVGAWSEILPEEELACSDPLLRDMERRFRRQLVKQEIGDDEPVEEYFPVEAVFRVDPANTWGVDVGRHSPDEATGAWGYDPPLKTKTDFDRLRMPVFTYDRETSAGLLEKTSDILGDILPVRPVCGPRLGGTLGTAAAELRGLTEMMMDMAISPDLMHRLMGHIRDAVLKSMDAVEQTGLLTPNNHGPMTASEPVGPAPGTNGCSFANLWMMANSQEFDQVSPQMWEEFCLNYQKPIFECYGLVGYGCCENLTHKMSGVLSIANLRIFVCSAWTDLDRVIEKVGEKHVIMWRQKASDVVFPDDDATIRRDLDEGMKRLKGLHVQIVLRELQTLAGHPDRLHVWTRYAREAAEKYA
ncbi:MAG: hypothetical protein JW909_14015 [Planctomycetes bacterium]|nr:hypothetical protein [Planctomycetota bacterium]